MQHSTFKRRADDVAQLVLGATAAGLRPNEAHYLKTMVVPDLQRRAAALDSSVNRRWWEVRASQGLQLLAMATAASIGAVGEYQLSAFGHQMSFSWNYVILGLQGVALFYTKYHVPVSTQMLQAQEAGFHALLDAVQEFVTCTSEDSKDALGAAESGADARFKAFVEKVRKIQTAAVESSASEPPKQPHNTL